MPVISCGKYRPLGVSVDLPIAIEPEKGRCCGASLAKICSSWHSSRHIRGLKTMPKLQMKIVDRRKPASTYLLKSAYNKHSQVGEDGVIEKIFSIIGTNNKWCVEFGAWDGIHFSNTCRLLTDFGWTCVQIEGNEKKFEELEANFKSNERSIRIRSIVGYTRGQDTIDDILSKTAIPKDFDLISIDIDGNDWYVWESIVDYRPRIVVIEFNPSVPNDVVFIQDRDMHLNEGCSLAALIELGKQKGYELICATPWNGIFVVKEEFDKFNISENEIDDMYLSPQGRIFSTFSGKIYHTATQFGWALRRHPVRPDMFQILQEEAIIWSDGILKQPLK